MTLPPSETVAAWRTGTVCGNPKCRAPIPPGSVGFWQDTQICGAMVLVCPACAAKAMRDAKPRAAQGELFDNGLSVV